MFIYWECFYIGNVSIVGMFLKCTRPEEQLDTQLVTERWEKFCLENNSRSDFDCIGHLADSVSKSQCPFVCMSVCVSLVFIFSNSVICMFVIEWPGLLK